MLPLVFGGVSKGVRSKAPLIIAAGMGAMHLTIYKIHLQILKVTPPYPLYWLSMNVGCCYTFVETHSSKLYIKNKGLCTPNPLCLEVHNSPQCSLRLHTYGSSEGAPCTPSSIEKSYGEGETRQNTKIKRVNLFFGVIISMNVFQLSHGVFFSGTHFAGYCEEGRGVARIPRVKN